MRRIPSRNDIKQYFHCGVCLAAALGRGRPVRQSLEVGWTPIGLQVWCRACNGNVLHIDLEGATHPANPSRNAPPGLEPTVRVPQWPVNDDCAVGDCPLCAVEGHRGRPGRG